MPKPTKPKPPLTAVQKLAIARKQVRAELVNDLLNALFINGQDQVAYRLVLKDLEERDLGGWSRGAAADQIQKVLKRHNLP